jgi:hypothetical protein
MRLGLVSSALGTTIWGTPSVVVALLIVSATTWVGRVTERRKAP